MAFHCYNEELYNVPQYNADANTWLQACSETITSSDARIGDTAKPLSDTLTLTDAVVKDVVKFPLTESILAVDALTKQVTNKGLSEIVRVNDWVQIERSKETPNWSNP